MGIWGKEGGDTDKQRVKILYRFTVCIVVSGWTAGKISDMTQFNVCCAYTLPFTYGIHKHHTVSGWSQAKESDMAQFNLCCAYTSHFTYGIPKHYTVSGWSMAKESDMTQFNGWWLGTRDQHTHSDHSSSLTLCTAPHPLYWILWISPMLACDKVLRVYCRVWQEAWHGVCQSGQSWSTWQCDHWLSAWP